MIEEFKKILDDINNEFTGKNAGNTRWTKEIKEKFTQLGKEKEFVVRCSSIDNSDDREWLYDLVWLDYCEPPAEKLKNIFLILECEWSGDFMWDFSKLLIAKSDFKIFILEVKNKSESENLFNSCQDLINSFEKNNNDSYLISCRTRESLQFEHRVLTNS
ncbi:MAG: hypothetical protein OEZ36_00050 [Spirochaetota bacterium]|nr:hypothetical protein [Spirochaetota bacterium]